MMSLSAHTYDYDCRFGIEPKSSTSGSEFELPALRIQYFYSSPLPIDDPLSVIPSATSADSKAVKHVPQPFSAEDNEALERAWQNLISGDEKTLKGKSPIITSREINDPNLSHCNKNIRTVEESEKTATCDTERTEKSKKSKTKPVPLLNRENTDEPPIKDSRNPASVAKAFLNNVSNTKLSVSGNQAPISPDDEQILKKAKLKRNESNNADQKNSRLRESWYDQKDDSSDFMIDAHSGSLRSESQAGNYYKERVKYCTRCFPMQNYEAEVEIKNSNNSDLENIQDPMYFVGKVERGNAYGRPASVSLSSGFPVNTPKSQLSKISWSYTIDLNISRNRTSLEDKQAQVASNLSTSDLNTDSDQSLKLSTACNYFSHSKDSGTTGRPFVKLDSRPCTPLKFRQDTSDSQELNQNKEQHTTKFCNFAERYEEKENSRPQTGAMRASKLTIQRNAPTYSEVPVGISKLHLVELPMLQMKPIYWSPVHDTASVTRGTWFFKETMYPVDPAISNQLELGYCKLKPWSQTWKDEIESALAVGALGEEKIVYRLWPKEKGDPGIKLGYPKCRFSSNQNFPKEYLHGEIAAEGIIGPENDDQNLSDSDTVSKKYPAAQILYQDSRHAFILKPSLQPSAYYGRRPLQKIKKGITVGIPVVRGFDWKTWNQLHPSKKLNAKNKDSSTMTRKQDSRQDVCPACRSQQTQIKATDLVLVVHGIGQKLSERVESFNFTHAVNDLRRSLNAELSNGSVKRVLRNDWGGMMVLPVNWRSNLSFDDGGLMNNGDYHRQKLDYSLPDVTQESLPAVRRMISDVMLDIPYYMSHHKPKMIQAVIQEANRVYRLWCKNNPGFEERGRVHLIAHSLGSVMIMEILSKQPTITPKLNLLSDKINTDNLDFKTTNCFFVGSPAGFFLLLEQKKIYPRRGLVKPDAEGFDDSTITGNVGDFGCMVIDNLYNVMHYNDPIAYRLNSTVDRKYAESLKEAQLPSATTGIFESFGKAIRSFTPGITPAQEILPVGQAPKASITAHLPSNLEMDVHDFIREETAERKVNLVNDNGQIDWYMNSGRGPLEIQYLNMLGAHSSYWTNPDFVRMVVVECGRKPGKNSTLASMRAAKITRIGRLNERR